MSKKDVHRALSNEVRVQTLKFLYTKPHTIEELAEKLKLQPVTIRHHIQALQDAALLETYEERTGLAGRPKTFYKIAKVIPEVEFPARRYFEFSKALVSMLLQTVGKEKTQELLTEVGRKMGKESLEYLEGVNKVTEWTPEKFAEIVIGKYFQESGAEPEIIEITSNKVVYRLHNCLFQELSQEMPDLMCDILHHEFQKSLLECMKNNITSIQTSCMGHGGSHCEHQIEWLTPKKQKKK